MLLQNTLVNKGEKKQNILYLQLRNTDEKLLKKKTSFQTLRKLNVAIKTA